MSFAIKASEIWKSYVLGAGAHVTLKDAVGDLLSRVSGGGRRERRDFWALKDLSFEIATGEAVGLIGHNGAGKSTLFKLLARITLPSRGEARVRGRVGSLLEVGTGFHPELTGRDNVFLNGAILGMSRAETQRKFDDIVAFAEVAKFVDTPVKRYSSGMQMRLAFSVAAHLEPDVMLIDEVLAVGDQAFQNKCLGRVREIEEEGRTVVFVSHNMGAVRRLCQRGILLHHGEIAADGPIESVTQKYYELIAPEATDLASDELAGRPATLVGWRAESSGRYPEHVTPSETQCKLVFDLEFRRSIPHVHFRLTVFTPDGITLSVIDSLDTSGFVKVVSGAARVEFLMPNLPLAEGLYDLYLEVVARRRGRVDAWNVRPSLRVVDGNAVASSAGSSRGLLNLRAGFDLDQSSEGPAASR